jgi:transposase InsO family protein
VPGRKPPGSARWGAEQTLPNDAYVKTPRGAATGTGSRRAMHDSIPRPHNIRIPTYQHACGNLLEKLGYIDGSRMSRPRTTESSDSSRGRGDVHWFETLEEAKKRIEAWRCDYNESRPHQALQDRTPAQFAIEATGMELTQGSPTAGD